MKISEQITEPIQVFMLKWRKKIITIVMILLIMLNIALILIPLGQRFYKLHLTVSEIKGEIETARHDQGSKDRMDQAFMWSKTRLVLDEYSIAQGDVSQYLEAFSKIADESNVRLVSMQPITKDSLDDLSTKDSKLPYRFIYFKLAASAGYHEAGDFVSRIERYPYFMEITSLQIKGNNQTPTEHDMDLEIRMLQGLGKKFK